jgi:hypothetical protein
MSDRAARARTTALSLCLGAAITVAIAALLYMRTIDIGLDDDALRLLVGLLAVVAILDLVMARFMYVRLSGRK